MAKGVCVVRAANPKGHFEECIISGTPKPGTCMEVVGSTEPKGNSFTYRACTRVDGSKGPVAVLREDDLQGKTIDDAYVAGTKGFLYWPIAGEELNMLLRNPSGTGTLGSENIGDLLEIDGATGMLQAVGTGGPTGAHASAPFMLLEHMGIALTGNTLVRVKYLGNLA